MPADASETLEIAMRDALPHLFEHSPDLLYQLVTLVSPAQLKASPSLFTSLIAVFAQDVRFSAGHIRMTVCDRHIAYDAMR